MPKMGCCKRSHIAMGLLVVSLLVLLPNAYAAQNAGVQGASQPKLNIVIVEGDGAINNLRQRVAREVIIQVNDENNRPIGGATVSFLLPASGPGGLFGNGTNLLTVATDAAGRATASFTPNTASGAFQLNASASSQGFQSAATVIQQTNTLAAVGAGAGGAAAGTAGGLSAGTIAVVAVAAAAAAVVGIVAIKEDSPAQTSGPTVRIGAGASPPVVSAPGGWMPSTKKVQSIPRWRP